MYPSAFYNLFPAFPQNDDVFVAMSFDDRFTLRYRHVIEPAIRDAGLRPYRIDASSIGDSIPLKILKAIGESRLVFADITALDGHRNSNVMYELGIAHAVRRPEEVIAFRSDDDRLPFDIAPIFANRYFPDRGIDGESDAKRSVTAALKGAIEEVELVRHLAVARVLDSLDAPAFEFLAQTGLAPWSELPQAQALGDTAKNPRLMSGFSQLLAAGIIKSELPDFIGLLENSTGRPVRESLRFAFTPLGAVVAREFAHRFYGRRTPQDALGEFLRIQAQPRDSDSIA